MDYAFERDWQRLLSLMGERFGEEPDITTMVFAVGLQEVGQGARSYKKDEKVDLMHGGVCTLLEPLGHYKREGEDEDGWPHFERIRAIEKLSLGEQEQILIEGVIHYFKERENEVIQ